VYFEYICWKFAGRWLDCVNTLLVCTLAWSVCNKLATIFLQQFVTMMLQGSRASGIRSLLLTVNLLLSIGRITSLVRSSVCLSVLQGLLTWKYKGVENQNWRKRCPVRQRVSGVPISNVRSWFNGLLRTANNWGTGTSAYYLVCQHHTDIFWIGLIFVCILVLLLLRQYVRKQNKLLT